MGTICWKNLASVRETSGVVMWVGKRARVPECKYKYFITKKCMDIRGGMEENINVLLKWC